MSQWKEFEQLAQKIYAELSPHAQVVWNDFIQGSDTGILRQIDVSVRWQSEGRDYLTIIQAKNWTTRADINVVGEFASVIRDVGASGGVLICNAGFSNNARRYAANIGIQLMNLHDASRKEWRRALTIPIIWIELATAMDVEMEIWLDAGDKVPTTQLQVKSGKQGSICLTRDFADQWNADNLPRSSEEIHKFEPSGRLFIAAKSRFGTPIERYGSRWECTYRVERTSWLGQFEPKDCRGLVDYLDNEAFQVSYLPVGEIPTSRQPEWVEIKEPADVSLSLRGTFVTTEQVKLNVDGGAVKFKSATYLGPATP